MRIVQFLAAGALWLSLGTGVALAQADVEPPMSEEARQQAEASVTLKTGTEETVGTRELPGTLAEVGANRDHATVEVDGVGTFNLALDESAAEQVKNMATGQRVLLDVRVNGRLELVRIEGVRIIQP